MRRHLLIAALAGVVLGSLVVAGAWWQWNRPGPASITGSEAELVRIHPGMTLSAAADSLVQRGLLRDRRVLLLGARLGGQARALRAGLPDDLRAMCVLAVVNPW